MASGGARAGCSRCAVQPYRADALWSGPTIEAIAVPGARAGAPASPVARRPVGAAMAARPLRAAARPGRLLRIGMAAILAVCVAFAAVAVQRTVYRAVVAAVGLTPAYGGFAFRAVRSTTKGTAEGSALIVEGELVNLTEHAAALPAIKLSLRDGGAEIVAWSVELTRDSLAAGEAIAFRSMVPAPAAAGGTVVASLAEPERRIVGLR
jgi:hypothetical protein